MTVDALRSKSRRRRRLDEPEPIPIGELDSEIFDCPACARPLAAGTRRCPACSTRLIDGIKATKAAEFVVAGLLIGSLVGGGVVGAEIGDDFRAAARFAVESFLEARGDFVGAEDDDVFLEGLVLGPVAFELV